MKKLFSLGFAMALFIISSCSGGSKSGELEGVQGRPKATVKPILMVWFSFPRAVIIWAETTRMLHGRKHRLPKLLLLIHSGWMKQKSQTTNTGNSYSGCVIQSCARCWVIKSDDYVISEDRDGNPIDPPGSTGKPKLIPVMRKSIRF